MKTRAKFTVQSKTEMKDGFRVTLTAVTATNEENALFFKYTPTGTLEMGLLDHETAEIFEPGKDYYLDFTPAE